MIQFRSETDSITRAGSAIMRAARRYVAGTGFWNISMDEILQKLVRELGEAINDSINESAGVNEALERLRAAGHDVFLVLEATIALKDKGTETLGGSEAKPLNDLSQEDRQFLRSLNIRFDQEE
jgi:hypothetical protein